MYCNHCGCEVEAGMQFCPACGVNLAVSGMSETRREDSAGASDYAGGAQGQQGNPYANDGQGNPYAEQPRQTYYNGEMYNSYDYVPTRSKTLAGILHIALGSIGVGNFYCGKIGLGIVDVLFCWTGVPWLVNFIRGIVVLTESNEEFEMKYGVRVPRIE